VLWLSLGSVLVAKGGRRPHGQGSAARAFPA